MDFSKLNITIVGLGLIGGSYAMALKALNPKNIWAVDIDETTLKKAEESKIIDKGYLEAEVPLGESDLVIICLYPSLTVKFIKDNLEKFKKRVIITDSSGIKSNIVNEINSIGSNAFDFISGHPMAGNENSGIDYASKDLFNNTNYIITPHSKNKNKNIKIIEAMAKCIGCKNVVKISPQRHDEIIALTSHLTHIIAVSLVNSDELNVDTKLFIGGSFKDVSRVALINSRLWSELLLLNKDNVVRQLEIFENNIKDIKNAIINEDENYLYEKFKAANCKRRELK